MIVDFLIIRLYPRIGTQVYTSPSCSTMRVYKYSSSPNDDNYSSGIRCSWELLLLYWAYDVESSLREHRQLYHAEFLTSKLVFLPRDIVAYIRASPIQPLSNLMTGIYYLASWDGSSLSSCIMYRDLKSGPKLYDVVIYQRLASCFVWYNIR